MNPIHRFCLILVLVPLALVEESLKLVGVKPIPLFRKKNNAVYSQARTPQRGTLATRGAGNPAERWEAGSSAPHADGERVEPERSITDEHLLRCFLAAAVLAAIWSAACCLDMERPQTIGTWHGARVIVDGGAR